MMGMTEVERRVVVDAVVSGAIGKGDTVECLAGLFTVASIERRSGDDIHVVMVGRPDVGRVNVAFRVGGDEVGGRS